MEIPDTMTPAMQEALSLMPWTGGAIAEGMRAAGMIIARKCEAEQAHVQFWALRLAIEYGDEWRTVAAAQMQSWAIMAKEAKDRRDHLLKPSA